MYGNNFPKILAFIFIVISLAVPTFGFHPAVDRLRTAGNAVIGRLAALRSKNAEVAKLNYCEVKSNITDEENNRPMAGRAHSCPGIFDQTIYFFLKNGKVEENKEQPDGFYLEEKREMEEEEEGENENSAEKKDECTLRKLSVKEFTFDHFKNYKYKETLSQYANPNRENEAWVMYQKMDIEFAEVEGKAKTQNKISISAYEGKCFAKNGGLKKLYNCPEEICTHNTFFFIDHNAGILYNLVPNEGGGNEYQMLAKKCSDDVHRIQGAHEHIPRWHKRRSTLP